MVDIAEKARRDARGMKFALPSVMADITVRSSAHRVRPYGGASFDDMVARTSALDIAAWPPLLLALCS